MNKPELIAELAGKQGLSKRQAAKTVEMFFDAMTKELRSGGRVEIRGLCALHVKKYPSYTGRNPKSGEPVTVKPKKLPFFKVGRDLKKRVDR
jgi:integration host factor subunit beta